MFQCPNHPWGGGPVDFGEPSRQNLRVRSRAFTTLATALIATGAAWAQHEPGYLELQQRMATLHVTPLVEDWLAESGVPGAALAIVEGDQNLILEGFGLADTGRGLVVDPATTIFQVGDLVRSMTATAVLQLAEQGVLDLDSDLSRRADLEFLTPDTLGPLTAAQLLLHTAGLDQRQVATRARNPEDIRDLGAYVEARMPARIRSPGLVSIPSTHGYALTGRLIEIAAGVDFDTYLEREIFAPLSMSNTAVGPGRLATDQFATGYRRAAGQLTRVVPDFPQALPASSLSTTAADMAQWMKVVLSGGSLGGYQLLTAHGIDQLMNRGFTYHERLPGRTLAFLEGDHFSPRELYLASTGNGFSAVMVLLPDQRVGLFAAFNGEIDLWGLVYQILELFDSPTDVRPEPTGASGNGPRRGLSGFWQDAAVSQSTAEKLVALVRQDRIRAPADGSLIWRARTFVPLGSDCFQEKDSLARLCVVNGPNQERLIAVGDLVFEKLRWYSARHTQMALWIAFATLFLAAGWPRAPLPNRQSSLRPDDAFSPRWPRSLARLAAAVHFVFIASLTVVLAIHLRADTTVLLYEIPAFVIAALCLPLVAAGLTLGATLGLVPVWRSSKVARADRLRFTLVVLALLAFLPFLWSWNLLGFHL